MSELLIDTTLHFGDAHHDWTHPAIIGVNELNLWYPGGKQALKDVNLIIPDKEVTALIGPSGCGKSTLLKCLNRINDAIPGIRIEGDIIYRGHTIYDPKIEVNDLRRRFGWVAQVPNPFPKTIYENVAYPARMHGLVMGHKKTEAWVEECLHAAGLWNEVKDRLHDNAMGLSGGQMQRLCIARALAHEPDVILMDEPCSALDPRATELVEQLIMELRDTHAIVIVTHNMQQAARVSQNVAFMYLGELLESGDTEDVFKNPTNDFCKAYVHGRFG